METVEKGSALRIIGLLSWYDEKPDWLAACVASLDGMVDHLVAVDGAYALFPESTGRSPSGQAEVIRETCHGLNIGCTLYEPQTPWPGNEVEKRDVMFRLGECITDDDQDWYFVIDGDEMVTHAGYDLHRKCHESPRDVGEVTMWSHREHVEPHERPFVTSQVESFTIRVLFRALRGLSCKGKHYHHEAPNPTGGDPLVLWGDGTAGMEPAQDFSYLKLYHRNKSRDLWRAERAKRYYKMRDDLNIEGLMPA